MENAIAGRNNATTELKTSKSQGKRIVLTAFGSRGDLHPYMAIALYLQAQGHRAAIGSSENYRRYVEAEGIEFHAIAPDTVPQLQQDWEFLKLLSDCHRGIEYIICHLIVPHLRGMYSNLMAACQGADLLLTHPLTFVASLVAEKTGIPWVSSILAPSSFLSACDVPTAASSYEQAIAVVERDTALRQYRWHARLWSAPVRQLRAEIGLKPGSDPIFEGQHSPDLVLALFSRAFAEPQPDWPPQTLVTGFPFYDRPSRQSEGLSPELEQFLNSGPPPIVFTLGTTVVWTPGNFYVEGAAAAQQLGYRAVLLMGEMARQFPPHLLPQCVAAFEYAPHSLIFPRAAAIVHHGGVGTTGQALRSGRPSLIVPHNYDQPDNAERVARSGAAIVLERDRYSAATVAAALKQLLFDPRYAAEAQQLRQIVQAEDGIKVAGDALFSLSK